MAARSVSPGGALLRASRIFSIPPPLPKPATDLSSTAIFGSDTSTLPHPTHLSIITPQSSLAKGDWGFKRPLPLRSTTRTSRPIIRVEAIDTLEHVTEFGSAADHSLTLEKWQEMGIPITTPPVKNPSKRSNFAMSDTEGTNESVFEDKIDSTVHKERGLLDKDETRWKFKGPWLAGLSEGEFSTFIRSQIYGRKIEFRQFLRAACAENMTREQRRLAAGDGEVGEPVQASDVTEEQLDAYIKELRGELQTLYNLIRKFLDLPPPPNRILTDDLERMGLKYWDTSRAPLSIKSEDYTVSNSPYADTGPPKTHPSAGLGYTRSSAYIVNHPVHGPQKTKTPVQARVLMPKGAATGSFDPILGVGGFAAKTPPGETSFDISGMKARNRASQAGLAGLLNIEPEKVGGSKLWVQPKSASIDPKGRVILQVSSADPDAVAVKEERTHEIPAIPAIPERENPVAELRSLVSPPSRVQPTNTNNKTGAGYGIGAEDFER